MLTDRINAYKLDSNILLDNLEDVRMLQRTKPLDLLLLTGRIDEKPLCEQELATP